MKITTFFLFMASLGFSQNDYPKNYFRNPLDIPMQLSGCFGELRSNHFHSGFDIKTNKVEGLKVYAVADGYVSRIKIATYGYGKAIYITHPNGYTSLYGHLSKANGLIEKYIKDNQYNEKSYEIELFLKPNELPVKKSDIIAFSGNTGGSGGPHLHFEFRNSKTDDIINPMFFGFDKLIEDSIPPKLNALYLYPLDEKSVVNQSNAPISANLILQNDGSYLAEKLSASGRLGLGINVIDLFNKSYNRYGVYKVALFKNGKSVFEYEFNSFSFEQFRYINALVDYQRYDKTKQWVQKLFMKNYFPLSIVKTDESMGVITATTSNVTQIYRIEISDFHKNTTIISVPIVHSLLAAKNTAKPISSKYFIKSKTDNIFEKDNVEVSFPSNVFYEDFFMNFDVKNDTIIIHNSSVPVHSNYFISITDTKHTDLEMSDYFIGKVENKKIEYISTTRTGNVFKAKTKELGTFILTKDTIKPKISITKSIEGKIINGQKNIQFIIADDKSGLKSFDGFINEQWVLFEYEYKNKRITYNFDPNTFANGLNTLRLVVIDNVGNLATFDTEFYYSQ